MTRKVLQTLALLVALTLIATLSLGCAGTSDSTSQTQTQTQENVLPAGGGPGRGGGPMAAADTSSVTQKWLDVPYAAQSTKQKVDIYLPNEGNGPFPLIISIHGGAFKSGDKADGQVTPMLEGLKQGYAVASIGYRLSSEAIFPAQVYDVKAAIRFLKANAAKYNINPDKIAVWGGSAGAYLAVMAGTSGDVKELEDLTMGNETVSSRVQAVVDWFGPIAFDQMDAQFTQSGVGTAKTNQASSPESQLLGSALPLIPDLVKKANPEIYISQDDPPFFIQHGTKDGNVPSEQSINLAANLAQVLGKDKVTFELLEGAGHGGQQFTAADNLKKVFAFLDKILK